METNKIKAWCFKNKKNNTLEPLDKSDGISPKRWQDGYGIFGTKKDLLRNVWNDIPDGYKAVRIEMILKEPPKIGGKKKP